MAAAASGLHQVHTSHTCIHRCRYSIMSLCGPRCGGAWMLEGMAISARGSAIHGKYANDAERSSFEAARALLLMMHT